MTMTVADILSKHGIKLGMSRPVGTTRPAHIARRVAVAASTAALRCLASLSGPTARCTSAVITAGGLARRRAAATAATAKKEMIFPPMSTVTPMACRVSARCVIYRDESRDSWLERADGRGGWIKGTKGVDTKLIYRADQVKKATAEGRIIACAEGEKDADSLWSLGIAATCNAHGASEPGKQAKWTKAHSEQLAGADIVVFNDNDAAGYKHAAATCTQSLGIARRVRRLDLGNHWPEIQRVGM